MAIAFYFYSNSFPRFAQNGIESPENMKNWKGENAFTYSASTRQFYSGHDEAIKILTNVNNDK